MMIRLAVTAWLLGMLPASAETRVALVIGNGAYEHADKLGNPTADSRAMRDMLGTLGFTVVYGENLSKRETERTIGRFAAAARESDVALAYYAGHGATFGSTPYIVPVDAQFTDLDAMPYELVPLESMVSELRRAKGIRIAIVDACRDNSAEQALKRVAARGGTQTRGLGRIDQPEGLIVAYATQYNTTATDGQSGGNSPFTAALLKTLPTPGLDIKDVFFAVGDQVLAATNRQQRPEIAVSIYGKYALVPPETPVGAPAEPAMSASLPAVVAQPPTQPAKSTAPASGPLKLIGHRGAVASVAFSPDGTRLASAGEDAVLRLWDASTGRLLRTMEDGSDYVRSVSFSPDGALLVSAGEDKVVRLWTVETGELVRAFSGHRDVVRAALFSPDGTRLVSGSDDGTVRVWDIAAGRIIRAMAGHAKGVRAIALTPDGAGVVSASADGTSKLWDVASGKLRRTFSGHTDIVHAVAISPDGAFLATGSADRSIKVWPLAGGPVRTFAGHTEAVHALAFAPSGATLTSGSWDNSVKVWDLPSGTVLRTFDGHTSYVYSVAVAPDGERLASAGLDETVRLWPLAREPQAAR